ncbi:transcriptional regulator with XRE-family HTH domain [Pseudochelatococcus lubricantis]|uniref:Transcriptional regulator with XRE-family HTH domain n=1 Tax=Pseudochelatococcus lubricantis TaxID=1538102 RepID=A0ABX0UZL3_9HYPH|nr:helix-turn-helix domain-containing protein [Pseudochelatococcus lubricantis]NIJ58398.1 transcriptional regulator with XRE-family HTH domain [Pseudochelatococcus lubricantis]
MTPFGMHLRALRAARGVTQKEMAQALRVSSAYLSALEHGKRGKPTWALLQSILNYFNLIWDDADALVKLADISDPRVVIDTAGLSPKATLLANRLSGDIAKLTEPELEALIAVLDARKGR